MYRPAREGRSCEHFGGYKTINQIPLPLVVVVVEEVVVVVVVDVVVVALVVVVVVVVALVEVVVVTSSSVIQTEHSGKVKGDEYHCKLVKSPVPKHTSQQHNHMTRCISRLLSVIRYRIS